MFSVCVTYLYVHIFGYGCMSSRFTCGGKRITSVVLSSALFRQMIHFSMSDEHLENLLLPIHFAVGELHV